MNSSHGKIIPDQCHRSDVKWDHRRKLFCSKEDTPVQTQEAQ